jgi:putative nucleotidyltransferase with HDIG domain
MTATLAIDGRQLYTAVPLAGLAAPDALPFPLFLQTGRLTWVLYRDVHTHVQADQVERLAGEGVGELFIHNRDLPAYLDRIEQSLDEVLLDRRVPIERRADVLHGVAVRVATEVLAHPPDRDGIARAQRLLVNSSSLVLRENRAFSALRALLGASRSLAQHSVTVGFLSMGLARHALSAEPNVMLMAGLAGLFHDVGKLGYEALDHDPEHCQRGHDLLARLGLPGIVCEAALAHHERWDGTGFPRAQRGGSISEFARVVGLADVFDKVYSSQQPKVGVFDAMRIMAQAYRGCFEERLAVDFVKLFR